jgi:hypothetical protein
MATLDDSVVDRLRELDRLRRKTRDLRERGRKALAMIPGKIDFARLKVNHSLSIGSWISGNHPIDIALLLRALNNQNLCAAGDLGPCCDRLHDVLKGVIESLFERRIAKAVSGTRAQVWSKETPKSSTVAEEPDAVPILTAARAMHALLSKSTTVFSAATMLCYYQIVRELYLAMSPNWIIGAARAGNDGRVSAFVTGECVRTILAFRDTIKDTITFFTSTKKLLDDLERLKVLPDMRNLGEALTERWNECKKTEVERIVLDWYATNNLRRNVIALDCLKDLPVFDLATPIKLESIDKMLQGLRGCLQSATEKAVSEFANAHQLILTFRLAEDPEATRSAIARRLYDASASAHKLAFEIVEDALLQAKTAEQSMAGEDKDLSTILDKFIEQYKNIYKKIGRVIEPAKRYIQDVLNRELAHAANSTRFDPGELLFAAATFGAITKWKQNAQLTEARRKLVDCLPEDGAFNTSHPIYSDVRGSQLMPIAFEMTRCFAQLMRKDFGEDLDDAVVRRLLNLFDNPIDLNPGVDETVGWNFGGAPESRKPSVWVTAVGVFALDRITRMLNERINATVLRHFNVDWPEEETDPWAGILPKLGGKMNLNSLMSSDYELQARFEASDPKDFEEDYRETPPRMTNVSLAIRLQQMRAHLTRGVLPPIQQKAGDTKSKFPIVCNALLYGPPGTGKTTQAEALAATAKVPLVRLSPSDLMVQGSDVIESRARAIFESLSMLTNAVIFLDEFEPVVRARTKPEYTKRRTEESGNKSSDEPHVQDPAEFRFLVTGMLPKLTKLNKEAAAQSVVYIMATNHLIEIDAAAKREGRFDYHIPIYNPDPMSRLLTLFYRLLEIGKGEIAKEKAAAAAKEKDGAEEKKLTPEQQFAQERQAFKDLKLWLTTKTKPAIFGDRLKQTVAATLNVSAQSLMKDFFPPEAEKGFWPFLLSPDPLGQGPPPPVPSRDLAKTSGIKTPVERDIEIQLNAFEELWASSERAR